MTPSSPAVPPCASTSSSGLDDGLGRRILAFDREGGVMLERLVVRPELAAFEPLLRDRIDRLHLLEDERLARPRTIVRNADGAVVVVSEFVPGGRLGDLLDRAAAGGAAPGVDAAVGFLIDVLPALCALHAGARFAHGTIAPGRVVVTPEGLVVLLDAVYGDALGHLRYGRRRLWTDFSIAFAAAPGADDQLDGRADVAQTALAAVMIVLGRPLTLYEWPSRREGILDEAADIAQIRGGGGFAGQFRAFLEQALAETGGHAFPSADEALIAARGLAGPLGGLDTCRRALVDWAYQTDVSDVVTSTDDFVELDVPDPTRPDGPPTIDPLAFYDDEGLLALVIETAEEEGEARDAEGPDAAVETGGTELDLDALVEDTPHSLGPATPIDATAPDHAVAAADADEWVIPDSSPELALHEPRPDRYDEAPLASPTPWTPEPHEAPHVPAVVDVTSGAPAPGSVAHAPPEAAVPSKPAPAVRARRAKRTHSARARKDRLRSAASGGGLLTQVAPARPPVEPATEETAPAAMKADAQPAPAPASWLVQPDRAAQFTPVAPAPLVALAATTALRPMLPAPTGGPGGAAPVTSPAVPLYPPAPPSAATVVPFPAPVPQPLTPPVLPPPVPVAFGGPPPVWTPPPPPAPVQLAHAAPAGSPVGLKLKESAGRPRAARTPPVIDIYAPAPPPVRQEPARFPLKLACLVVGVMAAAVLAGRAYLPERTPAEDETASTLQAAASATPPFVPPAAPTGDLTVDSQPPGARVLLNGKPAGQTPLTIPHVPAGRHSVTVVAPGGSVTRTVRVEAGKTATLDLPIFSGWIGVFAPFVVEVRAGGRLIGTTEEPRLMLAPGRHELTFTNRDLGYRAVQIVEIEPGQVRSVTLNPRGSANLNATPWAEVWIDGQKVGDTPIANLELPLGTREVVFRHPQLGERRTTVTIKGNSTAAVSMEMSR